MFDFNYLHEEEINCLYILCKKLNDRKVDYVIGGAKLLPYYGIYTTTIDVDFFIPVSQAFRVAKPIFEALGYRQTEKIPGLEYKMENDIHTVDVLFFDTIYSECKEAIQLVKLKDIEVPIQKLEEIVVSKLARRNARDLQHIYEIDHKHKLDLDLVKKLAKLRKINDYENFLSIKLSQ
ncbi:MAG: DUF6036 family nucleotidyltransferase [Methanosarcinales archaeon]